MADIFVLDMPVELGLELMAVIRTDFLDAKWKLLNYVFHEVYRIRLCVLFVDLKSSDTSCVINGCVLEATYLFALLSYEFYAFGCRVAVGSYRCALGS